MSAQGRRRGATAGRACVAVVAAMLCCTPATAKLPFLNRHADNSALLAGPPAGQVADATPGDGLLAQRRGYGVIVDATLERQLNDVLHDLQRVLPEAPAPAHVYAMPDTEFRAYSTADGAIFIAMGMLQSLQSRDELAALLGHEYAHILLHHHAKGKGETVSQKLYGVGSLYLGLRGGKSNKITDDLLRKSLFNELALESVQSAVMPAMGRKQEDEADRLAADLLVRAGYNPVAIVSFMDRMVEWEARNEESASARETRTAETTRLVTMSDKSMSLNLDKKMDGLVGIVGDVAAGGLALLRRRHYPASKRAEAVRDYMSSQHGDADRPDERPIPWANDSEVQQLFAGVAAAHATAGALAGQDANEAKALAAKASASPAARSPYVRFITTEAQGRDPEGRTLAALIQELDSPDSVFALHYLVLDTLTRSDPEKALAVLDHSRKALDDPPELLPYSVRLNKKAGHKEAANLYLVKCTAYGDRGLAQACQKEQ
ncbi:M48 family metallopeptidase [Luteimonas lutimaris]|uniref:Peptidase M48 domain-containing protein n=1 Tax=Luteimonas lutimaris TaxID=698645 RepID=A0ABP7N1A6_9GAMM